MKIHSLKQTLAIGTVLLLASCGHPDKEKTALEISDSIPVKVASVSAMQTNGNIAATGLVTTENQANYAFKIGGVISRIFVQEGQSFKKGQLLATLNVTEINSSLDQAKLGVEKAKRDYTRALNLYKDSVSTLEQVQNAKTGLDAAQKVEDAVAFNAQYAKVFAVSEGFVTKKLANEGEVIAPGMPVLATNETKGNDDYTLKVGVTGAEWTSVRIQQKATVTLDGFPGKTFNAYVFRKSQAADQMDGSFQIELKLALNGLKPAVGMFGKAQIAGETKTSSLLIPYDALIEADGDQAFVFALNAENKVQRVPIVIASFNSKEVFVKSGLEHVSKIIVSNSAFLNEQSTIKIIK